MRGKAALVTGGSRGIGLAIAVELVRRGARVTVTARKAEALAAEVMSTHSASRATPATRRTAPTRSPAPSSGSAASTCW
jgi:NAD(P)-dependent dehydrogenase (short-subunit alcohol dehydrogenase family)